MIPYEAHRSMPKPTEIVQIKDKPFRNIRCPKCGLYSCLIWRDAEVTCLMPTCDWYARTAHA